MPAAGSPLPDDWFLKHPTLDVVASSLNTDVAEAADSRRIFEAAKAADPAQVPGLGFRVELTQQSADDEVALAQRQAEIVAAQEKANKVRGDNTKRDSMFRWALSLVTCMLVFTAFFMIWYMRYAMHVKNELPELVLVTWMGTTVVEAIGIVLIIAKYLFPSSETGNEKPTNNDG